jgi:O-antigen ligase
MGAEPTVARGFYDPAMKRGRALVMSALPIVTVAAIDPWGWSPFGPLRFALVSTVTIVIMALALGRAGSLPRSVRWVGGLFVGWAAAATVVAGSTSAWLGTGERHYGFVTIVLVAAAFVAGSRLRGDDLVAVRRGCIAAALVMGGYVLWELVLRPPVGVAVSSARAGGPFGSPAFLGAACCVFLPLVVGRSAVRIVASVGLVIAVVASGSRATLVALAVVGLVGVARRSKRRVIFSVGLCVLVVAAVLVGGARFDRSRGAGSRFDEWRIGVRAVVENPVLGAGPEGYRTVFPQVVDDAYVRSYGRAEITDRAHSGPLDAAIAFGVPGGVLYAALLVLVARRAWRSRSLVGAGVVAYLGQQLLLFPLSELDPLVWLLAGTMFGARQAANPVSIESISIRWNRWSRLAVAAIPLVVAAGVLDVAADHAARDALAARASLDPASAMANARRLVRLRPHSVRFRVVAARALETSDEEGALREALAALDRASQLTPDDPAVGEERALVLARLAARTGSKVDGAAWLAAYEQLVVTDPRNPRAWRGLALARRIGADSSGAEAALARADFLENRSR